MPLQFFACLQHCHSGIWTLWQSLALLKRTYFSTADQTCKGVISLSPLLTPFLLLIVSEAQSHNISYMIHLNPLAYSGKKNLGTKVVSLLQEKKLPPFLCPFILVYNVSFILLCWNNYGSNTSSSAIYLYIILS